ncbi:uncharacterized protein LOC125213209 isoform X2 [Salvia hispanica]|uniref:uncharacterized protein LOC125213209 isoform X2 n=1 Tax=Salvia hispanica TaxID=49212 RepID=UPI002008FACD|nr:uncharacterized protein LOC125213209 isoform X2 [Salvia hispanica]
MAFDCNTNHRKPLLFSDLFKNPNPTDKDHIITASASSPSSNSTQFLSSWDSSSSSSSEPDDADFIAELTRQMAERMLDDDEEHPAESVHQTKTNGYKNCGAETELDELTQPIIQNQAPARKERRRGRRVRRSESAQPNQLQKTEQQYRGGLEWGGVGINGYPGSGMQAVFLGGSGPRLGCTGTGVFLPRDPTELNKKSGCSMVLMPTRVLQVLEKHFSSRIQQDSNGPPLGGGPLTDEPTESNGLELGSSPDISEVQLPQEWTY